MHRRFQPATRGLQSLEIAKKHFGFEFWLTAGLFLFLVGMTIAQRLFFTVDMSGATIGFRTVLPASGYAQKLMTRVDEVDLL